MSVTHQADELSDRAREVAAAREELRAELAVEDDPGRAADLCERLAALTAQAGELREDALKLRFATLARINDALGELRGATTVPDLLGRAAAALCESCDFDRAVISRVHGQVWKAEVIHARDVSDPEVDRATREFLGREAIPFERHLLETELVRRRVAALIPQPADDDRAYGPMVAATSTRGYVAAPVMPAGRVIGFLHADCYDSARELTITDRDNLWIFAEGFGLIFEGLVLGERLTEQRAQALEAFASAGRQISELCDAEMSLDERGRSAAEQHTAQPVHDPAEQRLDLLFTAREREVLDLMVTGARNQQIADRLVLSESTVKTHVLRIRRKLRASNRAEAVSRYLQIGTSPPATSLGARHGRTPGRR